MHGKGAKIYEAMMTTVTLALLFGIDRLQTDIADATTAEARCLLSR
jgi:hypothetical protein